MSRVFSPLIGIAVELAISWLLIWLIERKNLGVLGLRPTRQRIQLFFIFFLTTALICSSEFFMRMIFASEQWQVNPILNIALLLKGSWWTLMSVLYEELIFRGVILYILVKRIGPMKGMIISSIAFGIYHWFSYGIIGNIPQMIYIFIVTGCMGWVLAYAYVKTFSLYIPIAIHFGWNLVHGFIFSMGSIGNGVFIPVNGQPKVTISYFVYYFITLAPMIAVLVVNYYLLKRSRRIEVSS